MVKRLNYLNELWLPRVQSEGAHFGEMDSQAPVRRRKPLERKFKAKFVCVCVCLSVAEAMASAGKCVCKWWGWYMSATVHALVSLSGCVGVCLCVLWHTLTGFSCL